MASSAISPKECYDHAIALFKQNQSLLLLAGAICNVPNLIVLLSGPPGHPNALVSLVCNVAMVFLSIGLLKLLFAVYDGNGGSLGDLTSGGGMFWRFLFTALAFGLMVGIGSILLVVPGILAALTFGLCMYLVVDRNADVTTALKGSARLTKGHRMQILLMGLPMVFLAVAGFALLHLGIVGSLLMTAIGCVSGPIIHLAFIRAYRRLLEGSDDALSAA